MNHLFKYAQQKPCVVAALKILVKKLHAEKRPVKQIVEIGTYMGGFTQILKSITYRICTIPTQWWLVVYLRRHRPLY